MYARISDDRAGTGLGVERQIENCLRLAADRGWTVAAQYVDNDLSAYRGKARPRFADLLADIEAGHLDAVVAYHQDRLTRTPAEFEAFLATCDAARLTKFTTVTGFTELGQGDGVMVARNFAAVAAGESDAKSRRIRRKNDQRAAQGLPHLSGQRPFGYERDGVTIREDEAAVIRAAAARFLTGESLTSITASLSEQGVRTSTGMNEWRSPTLRNLLKSPRIAGLREHRGEVVGPGAWPGIITEAQHRQITDKLNDPTRRTLRTPRRYVLSGMVRCGLCGAKMVSAPDSGRRRYGCRSGPDFGGCGKVYVSGDALDRFVSDVVLLRLDSAEMADALAGREPADAAHEALTAAVREDAEQLDELATAYAAKDITMREWLTAKRPIEARQEANAKRLARLTRGDALAGLVGRGAALREQWATLNLTRQAAIIATVVDHVRIAPATRAANRMDIGRVEVVWRS